MKYGFVMPMSDARTATEMGYRAEQAGWDAFFVCDAVWSTDPWVTLGAIAARTERIRLGTMLTPVSRRRPWKLASETATLDQLSNGRVILAVGLGAPDSGFEAFGEITDRKTRAELLDEGLDIISGLWRGQPFAYTGKHYTVQPTDFPPPPAPVQQPRIPIWVVGAWPRERSMQRVLRYDGLLPNVFTAQGVGKGTPDEIRAMRAYVDERRPDAPLDIIVEGETPGNDRVSSAAEIQPYAEAGATWWLETMWGANVTIDMVQRRLAQGPPVLRSED